MLVIRNKQFIIGHSFPLSISFHVDCVSDWLLPLFRQQWLKMIAVDQRTDPGYAL